MLYLTYVPKGDWATDVLNSLTLSAIAKQNGVQYIHQELTPPLGLTSTTDAPPPEVHRQEALLTPETLASAAQTESDLLIEVSEIGSFPGGISAPPSLPWVNSVVETHPIPIYVYIVTATTDAIGNFLGLMKTLRTMCEQIEAPYEFRVYMPADTDKTPFDSFSNVVFLDSQPDESLLQTFANATLFMGSATPLSYAAALLNQKGLVLLDTSSYLNTCPSWINTASNECILRIGQYFVNHFYGLAS